MNAFITFLKSSWLRRFIIYSNNDNCRHLSKINISKLFSLGDLYCREQLKNIRNPLWKNMVESWMFFLKSKKLKTLKKSLSSLLGNFAC